jgi:hypothetical protein
MEQVPKFSGMSKKQKRLLAHLQDAGFEVDDVMATMEQMEPVAPVEGLEEEGVVDLEEAPMEVEPPQPKLKKKKTKAAPKTLKAKGTLLKRKKNTTMALLEQLLAKLAMMGPHMEQPPKLPTSNNHVRVPTPAAFTGKRGSFQFFASKVESYATITNISKDKWVAVALQCMEEKPTKVWGTYTKRKEREFGNITPTWEEFREFMSKRYDSTDLVALSRQKLDNVYQGQETVERYIERFVTLLGDVETEWEISENDKIHMFLKGLNTQLRLACTINPQTGTKFADLDSLCTFVVKYESNLKVGGLMRQEGRKALGSVRAHPQPGRVQTQPPGPRTPHLAPVAGAGKIDSRAQVPSDRQCYFCKQYGHEQWGCRAKQEYLARKGRQALPPPPPNPPSGPYRPQWKDNGGGNGGNGGRNTRYKGRK